MTLKTSSLLAARLAAAIIACALLAMAFGPDNFARTALAGLAQDKLLHGFAAFLVTLAGLFALPRLGALWLASAVFLAGLGVEAAQIGTGRNADWTDAAANGAGIALALLAMASARFRRSVSGAASP